MFAESIKPNETQMRHVGTIEPIDRKEAADIATRELNCVLDVLDQLAGDDWEQPTDCTEWTIRDMTAHLAGACAGWATWRDFRRQLMMNPYMRKLDVPVDAINKRQLEDRAGRTPSELVAELRRVGPKAIRNRKNLPFPMRMVRIDAKPMPGKMSMAYLADVIYARDQWMHRMDICRATGKTLVIDPEHDGRLMDLVMRDMTETPVGNLPVIIHVTGALNASYQFGESRAESEIDIDFLTLNRRASGRISPDEAAASCTIRGDRALALEFLSNCDVLY